jgi:ferrous iron transport protein B
VVSTLSQTVGGGSGGSADGGGGGADVAGPGFAGGLVDVGRGLVRSAGDALLAVPGIVGLHLGGGGDDTPDRRTEAGLRGVFDESSGGHAQPAAAAFLVFVLLYVPCLATVATFGREFGWRWAAFSVTLSMVVAWLAAVGVFQVGRAVAAM